MRRCIVFFTLLLASFMLYADSFPDSIHNTWDELLKQYVVEIDGGVATQVNYQQFLNQRQDLNVYLDGLSAVTETVFTQWGKDEQLAFLINVYNAYTVNLILDNYPDIKSIRDIGSFFNSPWKMKIVDLFGEKVSLDYVEHELIRSRYQFNEPRIHFAVNCASIGCPSLRAEAYRGEHIKQQLEDQTRLFLSDPSRTRNKGTVIETSKIFKWYGEDFEQSWLAVNSVSQFLAHYPDALNLTSDQQKKLLSDNLDIDYLDYDWRLNDISK